MTKIIEFLTKTTSNLQAFDSHVQSEVQKYATKQCYKVAGVSFILGFVAFWVLDCYI